MPMSTGNTEHPLPHKPAEAVAAVREDARFGAAFLRRHGLRILLFFIGVLLPLWGFGELADELREGEAFFFDDPLLNAAHALGNRGFDHFFVAISALGYQWGVVPFNVLMLLWLGFKRWLREGLFAGVAVIGSALLNLGAKQLWARERPSLWESIAPEATRMGVPAFGPGLEHQRAAGRAQHLLPHHLIRPQVRRVHNHPLLVHPKRRSVLDRQHMPAAALLHPDRRSGRRLGDHRLRRHRRVAQKPRQADLSGPAAAQGAHPHPLLPTALHQAGMQKDPPFSRRRSPNRPSNSCRILASRPDPHTESEIMPAGKPTMCECHSPSRGGVAALRHQAAVAVLELLAGAAGARLVAADAAPGAGVVGVPTVGRHRLCALGHEADSRARAEA